MKSRVIKRIIRSVFLVSLITLFTCGSNVILAKDQFGLSNKGFLIQSARTVGKSTKGLWDVPGNGRLDKYKHGKDSFVLQLWEREGKDKQDRVFKFVPVGDKYYIKFYKTRKWYIYHNRSKRKLEASKTRKSKFRLEHVGNGRWKIYTTSGDIVAPLGSLTKNGTKLVIKNDGHGKALEWVFFDHRTNRSFSPGAIRNPRPVDRKPGPHVKKTHKKSAKAAGGLAKALRTKSKKIKEGYFGKVDLGTFVQDNTGNSLAAHLNKIRSPEKQWREIYTIAEAARINRDNAARRKIMSDLARVNVKEGRDKLKKRAFHNNLMNLAKRERDRGTKKIIERLANQF
jgi:hypothetical protein